MNPRPLTLFLTSSKSISIGRGIVTLITSPCLLAISVTSSTISLYSSSIANYSMVTICFSTITLLGGWTSLYSTTSKSPYPPIASTLRKIVSILPSDPNSLSNCLWYSIYCFGLPSFSCYVILKVHNHIERHHWGQDQLWPIELSETQRKRSGQHHQDWPKHSQSNHHQYPY